jgi:hypothetical protein
MTVITREESARTQKCEFQLPAESKSILTLNQHTVPSPQTGLLQQQDMVRSQDAARHA